jgi:hypothetical protein
MQARHAGPNLRSGQRGVQRNSSAARRALQVEKAQLAAMLNAASIGLSASELGQLADALDKDGSGNLQVRTFCSRLRCHSGPDPSGYSPVSLRAPLAPCSPYITPSARKVSDRSVVARRIGF